MKTFKKYILGVILLVALLLQLSCKKDFLEIVPKGQTVAANTADYENLLNGISITISQNASVYRGDEMAALQPYYDNLSGSLLRQVRLFTYVDRVYDPEQTPNEITAGSGYIIRLYAFNKVINEVMDSKQGTEAQKLAILAQAKVGRAICNFMFISDFTKPYNATTAATDLGIPNITVADVTQKDFTRETLQKSYDRVLQDLTEALPNLGVVTHRRKISKLAAEFYLARVYMAMNNYAAAKPHLDAAFLEVPKATIPLALYDYTVVLNPSNPTAPGTWLPITGTGLASEPKDLNYTDAAYFITAGWFQASTADAFVLSPQTASLYVPTDLRLNLYSPFQYNTTNVAPKPLGMRRRNTATTINVGATLPDMYLMRAEISARANDLTGAVADLETLRTKRISGTSALVPSTVASNQQALVRFILDERIREFAYSGLRWLDMRRLSQDPIYSDHVDYTHELYSASGTIVSTFQLKPERFALKYGEFMLSQSNGLVDNP